MPDRRADFSSHQRYVDKHQKKARGTSSENLRVVRELIRTRNAFVQKSTRRKQMYCSLEPVMVGSPAWSEFLTWSAEYIAKYWPESIPKGTAEAFLIDYGREVESRVAQGGRGLFFLLEDRTRVGIANIYISKEDNPYLATAVAALYIAELHIVEERQRQGLGRWFLGLLIQWGIDRGARALVVEVDKELRQANLFWSSLGLRLLSDRKRNVYLSTSTSDLINRLR